MMADEIDRIQEIAEREAELNKPLPYTLPPGKPGDCDLCGEWSGRLIEGACAPCRDRYARVNL